MIAKRSLALIFLICCASRELAAQTAQFTVRATSALSDSAIAYIADLSVPKTKQLPINVRPEEFLRNHCGGSLSDTYLAKVKELNPGLLLAPSKQERTINLPACIRWARNAEVTVREGDDLDSLLVRSLGQPSSYVISTCERGQTGYRCNKTLREQVAQLNSTRKVDLNHLQPGAKLVLPLITGWTTVTLKEAGTPGSVALETSTVLAALQKTAVKSRLPDNVNFQPLIYSAVTPKIDLVRPTGGPAVSNESCRAASQKAKRPWPYDGRDVIEALGRSISVFTERRQISPPRTIVRIVDTGFLDVLGTRFPASVLEPNPKEKDPIKKFGLTADHTNMLAPYPDYEFRLHGTQVAEIALGGVEFRAQYPGIGKLIGIHFAKAINGMLKEAPTETQPAKYAYFVQESLLLGSLSDAPPEPMIVNMSIGSEHALPQFGDLLKVSPSTLLVVAAGNDKKNLSKDGWYPANYGGNGDHRDQVLTVGAHDADFDLAEFSNRSKDKVDLLAPGCQLIFDGPVGREELYGTSFAAPLVTFTAALLRPFGVSMPRDLKTRILASVDYSPRLGDYALSSGTLNIAKALYVFDDVVELSKTGILFGDWIHDEIVTLCKDQEPINAADLLKVTPRTSVDTEQVTLRVVLRDVDGRSVLAEDGCSPAGTGIELKFRDKSTGDIRSQLLLWSEIGDFVPRYLP